MKFPNPYKTVVSQIEILNVEEEVCIFYLRFLYVNTEIKQKDDKPLQEH